MTRCKCWAAVLIAASLLPAVATYGQTAQEACDKGVAFIDNEDYNAAIAELNEAIRLDHNYADAYYYRGLAFKNTGDFDQALTDYSESIRLAPDDASYAYNERGEVNRKKGDLDQAIADYTEAIRLAPETIDADEDDNRAVDFRVNRAVAYRLKGEYDKAIADDTESAFALVPTTPVHI